MARGYVARRMGWMRAASWGLMIAAGLIAAVLIPQQVVVAAHHSTLAHIVVAHRVTMPHAPRGSRDDGYPRHLLKRTAMPFTS